MNAALQAMVIPRLRDLGFKGSLPDFRRDCGDHWDLLNFSFHRDGGALVMTLARCRPDGIDNPMGHIEARRAKVIDRHPMYRKEVGHPAPVDGDDWFHFRHLIGLKTLCSAIRGRIEEAGIWDDVNADGSETPYA